MNDPGLDDPIANDAKDIEKQKEDEHEEMEEDAQAFLEPQQIAPRAIRLAKKASSKMPLLYHTKTNQQHDSRWQLASTVFHSIAGTLGHMASAFSNCALVVHWHISIPLGAAEQNGIEIDDPKQLIGINAAQLAIALISNLFLLMNMARRVRFSIAQPITIIGQYLLPRTHGLTACASGPLRIAPPETHAFTQAFYYTIFATGVYFLVATLMVVMVWRVYKEYYDKEFQPTMSQ